ncbi:DUF6913 domain-containing protein [Sinomicrobium weinanense]|uniref:Uncharacterized protein n=1 Tax=Sinomicrobium weinanense TaxID=2842200 RepID=A0A926JQ61_9FLAO|nr:hypothetical protein [Sinomicrobium weinanense]MBC9795331.1 hypothetical protein [Sinomicrobium weinanense]MBU3122954.1 hypothetical protein [Sinomicrobium weinanense]
MFFKKYKEKAAYKILKKGLSSNSGERNAGNDKVSSLACVVNLDEFDDVEAFKELAMDIQVRQEHFRIIGYTGRKDANAYYGIPVFRQEDLGWKGEIRNDRYKQILDRPYDMLLSYYSQPQLLLGLATLQVRSAFKVGLTGEYEKGNDFILNTTPNRFPEFRTELIKYLTILNKI